MNKERIAPILTEATEALNKDDVMLFFNKLDELEELAGSKFTRLVIERFVQAIDEASLMYELINSIQGGVE
ncbi:hypothetical protein [Priestia megaterium]|uniref:hypothetical protein n=1 Tax=Priestia megaterium TaxID=1404 RepID=UPI003459D3D7